MSNSDRGDKKPGYMFDSARESIGILTKERQEEIKSIKGRQKIVRLCIGFFGGISILIIAVSFFSLITSSYTDTEEIKLPIEEPKDVVEKGEEDPVQADKPKEIAATVSEPVALGNVETADPETPVEELTIAQLRGVFTDSETGAARLFMALREIDKRKPSDLVSIYGLASTNGSYLLRRQVVKLLSRTSDRGADALLMKMLSDTDPGVRRDAAQALGTLGSRAALGYLHARLKNEDNREVKDALIGSIEKINGFPMSARERGDLS